MRRSLLCLSVLLAAGSAAAQAINIPPELSDEAALPAAMPRFAKAVMALQSGPGEEPASLFKTQLAAGIYRDALQSLDRIRAPLAADPSPRVRARYAEYVLYARAALNARDGKISFAAAYRAAFHALITPLDNRTAAIVVNGLSYDNLTQASEAFAREPGRQINYGTGGEVNGESIADAKVPWEISWSSRSYVTMPMRD